MTTPTASPKLFSSFRLRDLTLKNRVVMPPLTRGRAVNHGIPNDLMAEYYAQRTGVGLIPKRHLSLARLKAGSMLQGFIPGSKLKAGNKLLMP